MVMNIEYTVSHVSVCVSKICDNSGRKICASHMLILILIYRPRLIIYVNNSKYLNHPIFVLIE